jgi:hypothetical protein
MSKYISIETHWLLFKWRMSSFWSESIPHWIARHLIPKSVSYWVVIHQASKMTSSPEHENDFVSEQKVMDLLKWMKK